MKRYFIDRGSYIFQIIYSIISIIDIMLEFANIKCIQTHNTHISTNRRRIKYTYNLYPATLLIPELTIRPSHL